MYDWTAVIEQWGWKLEDTLPEVEFFLQDILITNDSQSCMNQCSMAFIFTSLSSRLFQNPQ